MLLLENHVFVDGVAMLGMFQTCSDNFDPSTSIILGEPPLWKRMISGIVIPVWCIYTCYRLFLVVPI